MAVLLRLLKNTHRFLVWPVLILFVNQSLQSQQIDTDPYAAGVAYKKEIGRDVSTWQWNISVHLPHVTHGVVHSKSMNKDVGYNIYLPPSYAREISKHYPVVYYCHGASGSESSDTKVVEYLIPEIESGRIGEVIYVFMNAGHYGGYRDNPENNVMAETLVIKEIIPAIESRYRTIPTREGRALMGFSMGGGGATRLALKYPDLFCAFASFSGALDAHPDSTDTGFNRYFGEDNAYHWATMNQEKLKTEMGLYFIVGEKDRLYDRHPPFLAHLHSLGISFNYRVQNHMEHKLWEGMDLYGAEAMHFLASHYEAARTSNN
ncbi:MAG: hypothetical protein KJT03_06040 [Verrucomicrobiae bacterium]|nr:hypothetical protein [Verrucomicrobiae bacterium]